MDLLLERTKIVYTALEEWKWRRRRIVLFIISPIEFSIPRIIYYLLNLLKFKLEEEYKLLLLLLLERILPTTIYEMISSIKMIWLSSLVVLPRLCHSCLSRHRSGSTPT